MILRSHGFDPAAALSKTDHPVLVQICDSDSLAPISIETEAVLWQSAEVIRYPSGHFDSYLGKLIEQAVSDQVESLATCRINTRMCPYS